MSGIRKIEGDFVPGNGRFIILAARFNSFIVDRLVEGAVDALRGHGVSESNITIIMAPGAFELPVLPRQVLSRHSCDAVIALGAVIRGGTPHFDYVAGERVRGLSHVSMYTGVPIAFGVLRVDSNELAIVGASTKAGNKGAEAAVSGLEIVSVL